MNATEQAKEEDEAIVLLTREECIARATLLRQRMAENERQLARLESYMRRRFGGEGEGYD